jgi:serine/threonine-protein kinase
MILHDDMPVPSQRNPELPPEIDDWWQRAAARDREQRFDSAKDLADALGLALGAPRPFVVPSVAPRRVSLTEIDATIVADGRETDAPLTNTRISSVPGLRGSLVRRIRSRLITSRMWFRRIPRRHLTAAAVVAGVIAGVAITVAVTSSEPSTPSSAAPVSPTELETPRSGPRVFVDESAPRPEPALRASDLPRERSQAGAAPSASAASSADAGSRRPGARAAPAVRAPPVKQPVKGRDYGI